MLPLLKSAALSAIPWIDHGFTTRAGGVSFDGSQLNLSYRGDDSLENVTENRLRSAKALGAEALTCVAQVHGTDILEAGDWQALQPPEADGLWTSEAGRALGVMVADCGPVLIADKTQPLIGAAHAGWKGAVGGVLDELVGKLTSAGAKPENLVAVLGQTIEWDSYEVGADFPAPILAQSMDYERYFKPSPLKTNHLQFNLPGFIEGRLGELGVGTIDILHEDTLTQPDKFFSYRYARQNDQPDYGRMMGLIALKSQFS